MSWDVRIEAIEPTDLALDAPFDLRWSVAADAKTEASAIQVEMLTDDARVLLLDADSEASPPEEQVPASNGKRVVQKKRLCMRLRKGLDSEELREDSTSALNLHLRWRVAGSDEVKTTPAFPVEVKRLNTPNAPKFFIQ